MRKIEHGREQIFARTEIESELTEEFVDEVRGISGIPPLQIDLGAVLKVQRCK